VVCSRLILVLSLQGRVTKLLSYDKQLINGG
jgi:hypothetical protein